MSGALITFPWHMDSDLLELPMFIYFKDRVLKYRFLASEAEDKIVGRLINEKEEASSRPFVICL